MNACARTCMYSHTLYPSHNLTFLSLVLVPHMNAWMHTCTPVHPHRPLGQSRPQLHTCTPIHVHPPCLVPTLPCPLHALVKHIWPTSLSVPSPSPYTCNHAYTHIPAPLCMDSCIPPVHSPSSTFPLTFTFTFMATLVPHAHNHPQVSTITLMPTPHPICIHLCPGATRMHPSPFSLVCFLVFYFILLTDLYTQSINFKFVIKFVYGKKRGT